MKTEVAQAAADAAVQKTVAGSMSAATGAASLGLGDVLAGFLGAPFVLLLAAFAGAAGVLSFLPPRPLARVFGTVALCTMTGAYAAPWAAKAWPILAGGDKFVAVAVAALLQIAIPILVEQGGDTVRALRRRLGAGDPPNHREGKK